MLGKERAKKLAKLTKAKERREAGLMLLDSPNLIAEGLKSGIVHELFFVDEDHEVVRQAQSLGIPVSSAALHLIEKLADLKTCAGLVALAQLPALLPLEEALAREPRYIVYGDRLADPGNLGTIARTAAAFGCDLLLLSEDSTDPFSSKALRASAGALLRLPMAIAEPGSESVWPRIFRAVAESGRDLSEIERPERLLLWLGNEAQGPRPVPSGLDFEDVTIRMDQDTESLNVAAAAAILLHHFRV